jgi:fructose-bisphosphate aldolase/2-amino-3,7-dideoxy-D-threo-hept-6-ulosonate synthase
MTSPLRLRRLTDPKTGRALLLSFTAGLELGMAPGLGDLPGVVGALAATGHVRGVILHAGALRSLFTRVPDLPCGTVVDLFGGTWMTPQPERREQVCGLEHAVRVGADAVQATVSIGSADEARQLRLCGQIARDCAAWGMPLLVRIDTMQTDARRQYSATLAGHGARMAYELGADLVVVNYSDSSEAFAEALRGVAIPVLIGGGPRVETDEALLQSVQQAVRAGAQGVALSGPLFWQNGPTSTLARLADILQSGGEIKGQESGKNSPAS